MNGNRNRLIQLIHVAKRDLALDESTYKETLLRITGKDSCSKLSGKQLDDVLEHLKNHGFKVQTKQGTKVRELADDAQSRMIRGLWLELHAMGAVRNPSEAAIAAFIKRHTKVERLEWLNAAQASAVIEHLKKWKDRVESKGQDHAK